MEDDRHRVVFRDNIYAIDRRNVQKVTGVLAKNYDFKQLQGRVMDWLVGNRERLIGCINGDDPRVVFPHMDPEVVFPRMPAERILIEFTDSYQLRLTPGFKRLMDVFPAILAQVLVNRH